MRIVFMGTPEFAAVSLKRLYADGFQVCGVFTQPDKQRARGMNLAQSPVKTLALAHGTPVFHPETLRDGNALSALNELKPDLIAVVAYGKLLPSNILSLPKYGCINIHGSILPKYRGAAPIQWAVLNGERETGVTSMYMAEELDAGDIIMIKKTEIFADETSGALYDRLGILGAALLSDTITAIENGSASRIKQDGAKATYAPPLSKGMSPIIWAKNAEEILCKIRGLNPWPAATAEINGVVFKVFKAEATKQQTGNAPGSIVNAGKEGIEIACKDGTVLIKELQAPGGKRLAATEYLKGHPIW